MLPFLKAKPQSGMITTQRKPDEEKSEDKEYQENQELVAISEDLIRAVHAKDSKAVADALYAAYDCLENHDESEEDDNSFEERNEEAASEDQG